MIRITVNSFQEFVEYEQWLFSIEFPKYVEIIISYEDAVYNYRTTKIGEKWIVETA